MPIPISTIPAKPRVRRKRKSVELPEAVTGPMLIAATYDAATPDVTLVFDRPVSLPAGYVEPTTLH